MKTTRFCGWCKTMRTYHGAPSKWMEHEAQCEREHIERQDVPAPEAAA